MRKKYEIIEKCSNDKVEIIVTRKNSSIYDWIIMECI
jgi:hypothetical protein